MTTTLTTIRIGKYEMYKNIILGQGSYSVVYKGRCLDSKYVKEMNIKDGFVAIKEINTLRANDKVMKMINDEIRIMEKISQYPDENIVTCYEVIDDIYNMYIVMEYCDSGDLSKLIGNPIKENMAKYYFKQIVKGLQYIDKHKIMHRDIKPKNLLLTNNKKTIKICDFGFAKPKDGLTKCFTVCGSPLYMAPELFGNSNYNDSIDIWSIGMILYEMLFGYHPFYKCKGIDELKEFVLNTTIDIPPKYKSDNPISEECIILLKSLLERKESERISLKNLFNYKWLETNIDYSKEIGSLYENDYENSETEKLDRIHELSESDTQFEFDC
jgi:serine/threonine protein kinase